VESTISDTVDPDFLYTNLQLDKVWPITKGNQLKVALIDTGIGTIFENNIFKNPLEIANGIDDDNNGFIDDIRGWNVNSKTNNTRDWSVSHHGSKVASTILAVAPEVSLIPIIFIGPDNYITESNLPLLYDALDYADIIGADIIVMPFEYGINTPTNIFNKIQELYNKDVIMLASIGNCDPNNQDCFFVRPPARISYVFGIGAIDSSNYHWWGSPSGNEVDFVTYGVDIKVSWGNTTNSYFEESSGTSFSVGIAGGIASLLKSYRPDLTNEEVRYYLKQSALNLGKKEFYGSGLPQLYTAMLSIDDITPPVIESYDYVIENGVLKIDFTSVEVTGIKYCLYQYKNLNDTSFSSTRECSSNLPKFGDFFNRVDFTVYQYSISPFIQFNFSIYDLNNNSSPFIFSLELQLQSSTEMTSNGQTNTTYTTTLPAVLVQKRQFP
jgi:hypothetical protein